MPPSKKTSIALGKHFEEVIQNCIEGGRFASSSEVIRAGLRLVERQEQKIRMLREAIEEGESSGYVQGFDPEKHLNEIHEKYRK